MSYTPAIGDSVVVTSDEAFGAGVVVDVHGGPAGPIYMVVRRDHGRGITESQAVSIGEASNQAGRRHKQRP